MTGLVLWRWVRKGSPFFACVFLACAAMTVPAWAQTPGSKVTAARSSRADGQALTVDGHFTLVAPPGWIRSDETFGLSAHEKRAWGLILQGPWRGDIGLRIAAHYYGNGGLQYRSIEHYLNVFSKPALGTPLKGSGYSPLADAMVAGRAAKVFERIRREFVPLSNTLGHDDKPVKNDPRVYESRKERMARPVSVRERFVVIPAEAGFFALRYTAGEVDFEAFLPDFETVLADFSPQH